MNRLTFPLPLFPALLLALPLVAATPNTTEVTGLLFTPDGQTLIVAGLDGNLRLWDAVREKERVRIQAHKDGIYGLALSRDGKLVATAGGDRKVRVWDLAKLKEIATLEGHTGEVIGVAFSPDGKQLASGGYDSTVRVWDWAAGKELHVLKGHTKKVTSVAFSVDGKLLASGGVVPAEIGGFSGSTQGDQVRLWDPATGKAIRTLAQRGQLVNFTPDGRFLVSGGMYVNFVPQGNGVSIEGGSRVAFWDLQRDREGQAISEYWHAQTFTPDGKFLATGWGSRLHMGGIVIRGNDKHKGIHLWETATGKEILSFAVPESEGAVLAISPDGTKLVAGHQNGSLRFHDLKPAGWDARAAGNLGPDELAKRWDDLDKDDAPAAYRAVWDFSAAGDNAVKVLAGHLKPAAPAGDRVRKLIAQMDSNQFEDRETAMKELTKLGGDAEGDLRRALDGNPSPELLKRIQALLEGIQSPTATPEGLRQSRAIHVLERQGSTAARELLGQLSKGSPGNWLTRDAASAIDRLARRSSPSSR
jgi:hypothetical protein